MARILRVGGAQMGPIQKAEQQAGSRCGACSIFSSKRNRRGCDLVVYPELALTTFFPALVHDRSGRDRFLVRARDAERRNAPAVRAGAQLRHRLLVRLRRAHARRPSLQHLHSGRPRRRALSASTARCICPAIPNTTRSAPFSIWRNAISSRATSGSRYGGPWAASSACASATIAAGPKPIGSWGCKASS